MKQAFKRKFISVGGQMGAKQNKERLLWAASTNAANVTKASLKSSTVPLQTTFVGLITI